jgi:hypothetical protein
MKFEGIVNMPCNADWTSIDLFAGTSSGFVSAGGFALCLYLAKIIPQPVHSARPSACSALQLGQIIAL